MNHATISRHYPGVWVWAVYDGDPRTGEVPVTHSGTQHTQAGAMRCACTTLALRAYRDSLPPAGHTQLRMALP